MEEKHMKEIEREKKEKEKYQIEIEEMKQMFSQLPIVPSSPLKVNWLSFARKKKCLFYLTNT